MTPDPTPPPAPAPVYGDGPHVDLTGGHSSNDGCPGGHRDNPLFFNPPPDPATGAELVCSNCNAPLRLAACPCRMPAPAPGEVQHCAGCGGAEILADRHGEPDPYPCPGLRVPTSAPMGGAYCGHTSDARIMYWCEGCIRNGNAPDTSAKLQHDEKPCKCHYVIQGWRTDKSDPRWTCDGLRVPDAAAIRLAALEEAAIVAENSVGPFTYLGCTEAGIASEGGARRAAAAIRSLASVPTKENPND